MILHWISVKTGTWHWFAPKGAGPRPLFAFAGLWQRHVGPVKKDGAPVEIDVYSFMTTTPNALVEAINHERMPVLLSTDEPFDTWINGPADHRAAMQICGGVAPNCLITSLKQGVQTPNSELHFATRGILRQAATGFVDG